MTMPKLTKTLQLAAAVLLTCLCLLSTLASAGTLPPTSTSSTPIQLARRQLTNATPTFDLPPTFASDVTSTVTTITTVVIIVWIVSILGSLCVLCAIGYCILSYTRRQKEKSRMAKERHQMEMEAWRQQQYVYGAGGAAGAGGVQRPQQAYGGPGQLQQYWGQPQNGGVQQQGTGQQQANGREGEWTNAARR